MDKYPLESVKSTPRERCLDHRDAPAPIDFAAELTLLVFRYRDGRALLQTGFVDRLPGAPRRLANGRTAP